MFLPMKYSISLNKIQTIWKTILLMMLGQWYLMISQNGSMKKEINKFHKEEINYWTYLKEFK